MDILTDLMRSVQQSLTLASDRKKQVRKHVELWNYYDRIRNNPSVRSIIMSTATTAPNASLPIVPIINDNVVTIDDIIRASPGVVHRDKILLCRSILPSFKINAVSLLVDDPYGKYVLRLCLYNFSKSVPVGTILAIMHPWFNLTNDDSAGVRCDNPMHVRLVESTDSIIQDVIWKVGLPIESGVKEITNVDNGDENPAKQGTRYYLEKNYSKALEYYTKAIEMNPKNPVLFSNRAQTYLILQQPSKALADAETGLRLDKSHLKLLYRKAKALLMLKRYRDADKFMDPLHWELLNNPEFFNLFEKANKMIFESEFGEYEVLDMIEESKQCKYLEYHADYAAWSMFEIKQIDGKGRGLVATRDIPNKTDIIVCKAFAFVIPPTTNKAILARCLETGNLETPRFTELVHQICDKLMTNPESGRDFYQLYAGSSLGYVREDEYDPSNPIDIDRIKAIVRMNSFGYLKGFKGPPADYDQEKEDMGVYLYPSYLNHSCVDANCIRVHIGDFMFVQTCKKIKRGEELLIEYIPQGKSYEERSRAFEKHWGFTCGCRLCVNDRRRLGHE